MIVAERDDAGGGVLDGVRVLGLVEVGEGTVLDDRDGVVAGGQLLEGVGTVRVRRGGGDDLTVLVSQFDGLVGVALLAGAVRLGAVTVTVDEAVDGVVRHITEVNVVLGGVVLTQGHRFGGVVLRGVRVLGLFGVGEFSVLDDRDGVGTVGQVLEGVVAVRVGRRGGDDLTVLVEELDDDAGVSGFCAVLVAVARVVAVDGARQGVVVHVAEIDVRRGRVVVVQRDGFRGVVLRGVRVTGLLEASDGAILNDRDGVGACGELIEGVGTVRVRRGRGHNSAVRVAQLNGHALVEFLIRVQRAGAVAVAVDRALDEVVGHVAEVDVLLGRVGLVQGDRLGRVVQRRVGVARLLGVG